MIDSNREIQRSTAVLTEQDFALQFMLTRKHPWLIRKSNSISATLALCEYEEDRNLIIDLISRMSVFDQNEHYENLVQIGNQIVNVWACSPDSTLILALDDKEVADSSKMVVQQMKGVLADHGGWKTAQFLTTLTAAVKKSQNGYSIVIVDDFSGSGESIQKKLLWLRDKLASEDKKVRILVAVATAMEASRSAISPISDDYWAVNWIKRGISDYLEGAELSQAIQAMERIECLLSKKSGSKKLSDYTFGWRRSEALYCVFGSNPPNNNFPIFWWPSIRGGKFHTPILPRI